MKIPRFRFYNVFTRIKPIGGHADYYRSYPMYDYFKPFTRTYTGTYKYKYTRGWKCESSTSKHRVQKRAYYLWTCYNGTVGVVYAFIFSGLIEEEKPGEGLRFMISWKKKISRTDRVARTGRRPLNTPLCNRIQRVHIIVDGFHKFRFPAGKRRAKEGVSFGRRVACTQIQQ